MQTHSDRKSGEFGEIRLDSSRKVLIAEDDEDIATLVCFHLRDKGADVTLVDNGPEALRCALTQSYDLLVLDLSLPGMDGIDVAEQLKSELPSLSIIIITARSSESDRVRGLDAGADDYVVKPFSMLELVARVRATLRRVDVMKPPSTGKIQAGDIVIDVKSHCAFVKHRRIELTAREFGLLSEFVNNPGQVFSRAELLLNVWGSSYDGYRHTVNTHINRLRNKVEPDPRQPVYITTVWGVGYKLVVHQD